MNKTKAELKREQRKRMIAEKSLEAFKEHGYHGASMSIISKTTDMSKGGIYAYFSSKRELFIYILDYVLNEKSYILKPVKHDESAYDQLIKQWERVIFSWTKLDHSSTKLIYEFWMESSRTTEYREKLKSNYSLTKQYFTDIIELGKEEEEFKEKVDAEVMAQIFWSYIDGQVQFWIARGYQPSHDELKLLFNQIKLLLKGICTYD